MTIEVQAVNVGRRLAMTSDGIVGDIVEFLGRDGDETLNAEDAAIAIVHWRGGGFTPVVLSDYEPAARH